MTALYDLMLLLDPNAPDGRHDQILGEVKSMIEKDGTLVGQHDWGMRRIAFEIDHRKEAAYHLFQFESEPPLLDRLGHQLKIADGVLRFRTIRLKPGSPPPPVPRAEAPRSREEDSETTTVAPRAAADAPAEAPEEAEAVAAEPVADAPAPEAAPAEPAVEAPAAEPAAEAPAPEAEPAPETPSE
jgi:small subunit ribosomal protein S6